MTKIKFILILLCAVLTYSYCLDNPHRNKLIIGAKIYEKPKNLDSLFQKFKRAGINTVFTSTESLSDETFKAYLQKNEIDSYVILPIFYAPDELRKDSSLFAVTQFGKKAEEGWVKFVCPSVEDYKKRKIKLISGFVKKHNPAGISLDFIRHFVFWEKIYPDTKYDSIPNTCFDRRCIDKYLKFIDSELPSEITSELEIYEWIQKNNFDKWVAWKNSLITCFVRDVFSEVKQVDPEIKIALHAVPWREDEFNGAIKKIVGQDFNNLSKYVDYISPMTYSHMLKRQPEWIHSVVKDIENNSNTNILPSIQVNEAYLKDSLSTLEFEACLIEALKEPSSGVVFWNWNALELNKEKLSVVERELGN